LAAKRAWCAARSTGVIAAKRAFSFSFLSALLRFISSAQEKDSACDFRSASCAFVTFGLAIYI
jgi:hypothetical protein